MRSSTRLLAPAFVCVSAALTACGGGKQADVCSTKDGAPDNAPFVFVQSPRSGERVASGFRVSGCASTFEGNVRWLLRGRDGRELASSFTQGGSLEPARFEFTVRYSIGRRQVGRLEVFEPRVTTEGFPPPRNVVPLVLQP